MGKKALQSPPLSTWVQRTENTLSRNSVMLMWVAIALYIFFSIFTFSLRISEGGDDSTYIIRALTLIQDGRFPTYQGPLYPAVLSLFILPFGLAVGLLKFSSWIFLTATLLLLFKAFKGKISLLTLTGTLFILVVNHHFLYYGSQTYSEAFFMMLQGFFILLLFGHIKCRPSRFGWHNNLILALLILTLALTRTIGVAALPALLLFLIFRRQYRDAMSITLFFVGATLIYLALKYYVWDLSPMAGGQATSLLYKHPYDFSTGKETFGGFIMRFLQNSNIYLSKYFLIMTGFKPALSLTKQPFVTLLIYAFFIGGIIRFFKKNPYLLFTGFYLMFFLGATFFSLQTLWDQSRLILPFLPLMILFLSETIVSYTSSLKNRTLQKLPLFILALSFTLTLAQTMRQTDFSAIGKQLAGDRYYGYTPDWVNYLKMAEYTSKELPKESYVACRKPNMACIYANGKRFYGIYRFQTQDADSLLTQLKDVGATHIIAASLRKNPRVNTGSIINTIHRYMGNILKKYPKAFILRKKMGTSEPAWLFEIDYSVLPLQQPDSTLKHDH